jgi:hypothetical protein
VSLLLPLGGSQFAVTLANKLLLLGVGALLKNQRSPRNAIIRNV